ncbi:MAG: hypothetical protein GF388_02985 [Candidatus Aegiribacteria sp.]|nr:hypothetical protein [Candidatus Aegiribacteria sp.]MBD3294242.1 hypothetical protein [Candidatus Fermentibacteria bacterium]
MNCSRAQKLISLVIDGEATKNQKRLLDFHLMGCPKCRRAMEMSEDISDIAQNLSAPLPPPGLEIRVREMLKNNTDLRKQSRFRKAILAIPAAAVLLAVSLSVLQTSSPEHATTMPMEVSMSQSTSFKTSRLTSSSKSGVRTAPLSEYSRQASLVSF